MEKHQVYPPDEVLLPSYLGYKAPPDNEPVGIWIDQKYFHLLWLFARQRLGGDGHRGEDALHDTAEKMCRWEGKERADKFTTSPKEVLPALHNRVRDACNAITRRHGYNKEATSAPEFLPEQLVEEGAISEILKMELRKELLKAYFMGKQMNEEWEIVELIFKLGHKTRSHLINQLGWSTVEAHNMITRVKRHLKKIRLSDDKNSSEL